MEATSVCFECPTQAKQFQTMWVYERHVTHVPVIRLVLTFIEFKCIYTLTNITFAADVHAILLRSQSIFQL